MIQRKGEGEKGLTSGVEDGRPDPGVDPEDAEDEVEATEGVSGEDPPPKLVKALVMHVAIHEREEDRRRFLQPEEPGGKEEGREPRNEFGEWEKVVELNLVSLPFPSRRLLSRAREMLY